MHGCFQGLGQNIAASVIIDLVMMNFWGNKMLGINRMLKRSWIDFKKFCKLNDISCSCPLFTRGHLSWNNQYEYPALKGKAWHCRVILSWLASVLSSEKHFELGGPNADVRCACVVSLAAACNDIESNEAIFEPEAAAELSDKIRLSLLSYQGMASIALADGKALYPLKPKMHCLDHLADDVVIERLNPRRYWNFGSEDFIGKIKRIARKSHPSTMARTVTQRYLLKMCLRWGGRDTSVRKQLAVSNMAIARVRTKFR